MHIPMKAEIINKKFFTPTVTVLTIIMLNGLVFAFFRFVLGIGAVTNLNNQYPWGIWIGIDVAAGVALAAGGFTSAALVYVFNRKQFHDSSYDYLTHMVLFLCVLFYPIDLHLYKWMV